MRFCSRREKECRGRRLAALTFALLVWGLAAAWARADDWPQWLGPRRDGVWRETGILDKFPKDGPPRLWHTDIGSGYAGPAVAGGRVYVTDRVLPAGTENPDSGFTSASVEGSERVLCLDEKSGKMLWAHQYPCTYNIGYPSGPRTTPSVAGGKVYSVGAMGDLVCLDAKSGELIWSKNYGRDYHARPGIWGWASHPLVDGNKLICIVGGPDHVVMAWDKDTGKELWHALSANQPGYTAPMIFEAGGTRQLVIWHPESVNGLDPETGKVYWSVPFKLYAPPCMAIPTPRLDRDHLFITGFYDGSLMLKLDTDKPAASVLWKKKGRGVEPGQTEALHSVMSMPVIAGDYIYGDCSYGELRCLKEDTGERVWMTRKPTTTDGQPTRWANVFLTPQGDRYFLFNELGDLIIARLSPQGYEEVSRAHIIEPTNTMAPPKGRRVVWTHPAYADKCIFVRNDKEIICVSLAEK